ncbi:hypothetical protein K438DRAFT_1965233 [Mycena galopus ATCC 62051]|nr:hypothetical protein K438DRAFT_1965233 [Mycena galopus ATCC 62051]
MSGYGFTGSPSSFQSPNHFIYHSKPSHSPLAPTYGSGTLAPNSAASKSGPGALAPSSFASYCGANPSLDPVALPSCSDPSVGTGHLVNAAVTSGTKAASSQYPMIIGLLSVNLLLVVPIAILAVTETPFGSPSVRYMPAKMVDRPSFAEERVDLYSDS